MTVDQYISPDVDQDLMNGVKDTIHTFQKLDSYFAAIMYQVQTLAFANSDSNLDHKSFLSSPISSMGVQMPSILSVNTNYLLELERKTQGESFMHSSMRYDRQSRAGVHLQLSDELVVDASEFMHAIYDDLSQINEMVSLNDPSLVIEGTAFFFNTFEIASSLEPVYLQALTRAAMFHGFLERTYVDAEKVIVDAFSIEEARYGMYGDVGSADSSLSEDEKYIHHLLQTEPPVKKAAKKDKKKKQKKKGKDGEPDNQQEAGDIPGVPGAGAKDKGDGNDDEES